MLEQILSIDKKLFIFLNGLGSEKFDFLWLIITRQTSWTPFFLFLLYLIFKKLEPKQFLFFLLCVGLLIFLTDQTANLFKNGFQRLRPCNDPEINNLIRIVQSRISFSFFSGHAANSLAITSFIYFIFHKNFKYLWIIFIWPILFAYSRIYLGLHFPLDILGGYLCGVSYAYMFFIIYNNLQIKFFRT